MVKYEVCLKIQVLRERREWKLKKYSYLELFWVNKVNSPFAELIMYYGGSNKHTLWLTPLFILFVLVEWVLVYPLIKIGKIIRRIK
jgi:hypothetical protein